MMNEKYNKDREKPLCAAEWRRNPMGRQEPIGVFDSGVGGLTVAREIMRQIPNERLYISAIRQEFLTAVNQKKP